MEECISAEQPPSSNVDAHCLPQTSLSTETVCGRVYGVCTETVCGCVYGVRTATNYSALRLSAAVSSCTAQGGGFCGSRTKKLDLDLSAYDGLQLRVKGDGQIFKFNIKTVGLGFCRFLGCSACCGDTIW